MEKWAKYGVYMFCSILGWAFMLGVFISTMFALYWHGGTLSVKEILYDLIMAVFVACAQMLWWNAEKDNKTYIRRSILNFSIMLGGVTVLMLLFGWLPPLIGPIILFLILFIGIYALIWIIIWKQMNKQRECMNEKLKEYKEK